MEDGLPMGSPLSAIMAEIIMNNLETKINREPEHMCNIVLWRRYVDDVFAIWDSTASVGVFLDFIKGLNGNITFTSEMENHFKQLNFLNLTLTKNDTNIIHT